jgi:hypothetical protein
VAPPCRLVRGSRRAGREHRPVAARAGYPAWSRQTSNTGALRGLFSRKPSIQSPISPVAAGAKSGEDFGRTMPEPLAELWAERRSTAFDAILAEGLFEVPTPARSPRRLVWRASHADVIGPDQLALELFKLNLDVCEMTLRRRAAAGGADMKAIHRSILAQALMTSAASLALMMMGAAGVRAEIVTVQGDDGAAGADGVNPGDNGMPGGDGESVAANAGSTQPITAPVNKATATGGNGGRGGNGVGNGDGANGGVGGAAIATAATTINCGSAEADANSFGGDGGLGGSSDFSGGNGGGNGGAGGAAIATSAATNADGNSVASTAVADGGAGGDASAVGDGFANGGSGGSAKASSSGTSSGAGNVASSASAVGGTGGSNTGASFGNGGAGGSATVAAKGSSVGATSPFRLRRLAARARVPPISRATVVMAAAPTPAAARFPAVRVTRRQRRMQPGARARASRASDSVVVTAARPARLARRCQAGQAERHRPRSRMAAWVGTRTPRRSTILAV